MSDYEMMITRIKNIYIMLLHAIAKENISIVDHYIDDGLIKNFESIIEKNVQNNVKQVFRQPNISNVNIIDEDDEYITVEVQTRYISYYVNRKNNKHVSGDNKSRITKNVILKFRKNQTESKALFSCPNCGAGLKINTSGICDYCGLSVDERFSPYVLCYISSEL